MNLYKNETNGTKAKYAESLVKKIKLAFDQFKIELFFVYTFYYIEFKLKYFSKICLILSIHDKRKPHLDFF